MILAALTFGTAYLYYLHLENQKVFINTYYFRTLQEVATEFNNNLDQLVRLHQYQQSTAMIQSIFASYQQEENQDDDSADQPDSAKAEAVTGQSGSAQAEAVAGQTGSEQADAGADESVAEPPDRLATSKDTTSAGDAKLGCGKHKQTPPPVGGTYTLASNRVSISLHDGCVYTVDIRDLMPEPRNDFVLYVIADAHNRVLSSTGGASGLSIIDTEVVSRAIQLRESQDWLKLATQQGTAPPKTGVPLPGYSTQIDVELNTGKARLFVLPFRLFRSIETPPYPNPENNENGKGGGVPAYLVGVQPENVIDAYENKRWNLSLLLLSLAALVFLWTAARLLMLSRHQPLGNGFRRVTVMSSYLTFIVLVALLLAFAHRNSEISLRQEKARELMNGMYNAVSKDLYAIFAELEDYRRFYNELLRCTAEEPTNDSCAKVQQSVPEPVEDCKDSASESAATAGCILIQKNEHLETRPYRGMDAHEFAVVAGDSTASNKDGIKLPRFSKINIYGSGTHVQIEQSSAKPPAKPVAEPPAEPAAESTAEPVAESTAEPVVETVSEWFDIHDTESLPAGGKLLSVFLMNEQGRQVLPVFYFAESNQKPESYSLAHRDYFRRVRDQSGWDITLGPGTAKGGNSLQSATSCRDVGGPADGPPKSAEPPTETNFYIHGTNFYIQRLLNLNTGTRGSTIGLPLVAADGLVDANPARHHILGADIVLPSLSLSEWCNSEAIQDMVVMVIDRVSGQVLYHMDDKRSMVENLYQAGRGAAGIAQSISSGRFGRRAVSGYYHGEPGDFMAGSLPISQWAVVVFIPDASTDSLMTDTFLASAGGMGAALLLLAGLLILLRYFADTDVLKLQWGIPSAVNRHAIVLFSSILLASIYFGYWLGEIIKEQTDGRLHWLASRELSMLALAVVLLCGYGVLRHLRRLHRPGKRPESNTRQGTATLLAIFLLAGLGLTAHLQRVGNKPDQALSWYYRKLHEARLNLEKEELHEIALTRYPNSIKKHGHDPFKLLPISEQWREILEDPWVRSGKREREKQGYVLPEDVGTFSQYTSTTDAYGWAKRYLLTNGDDGGSDENRQGAPAGPDSEFRRGGVSLLPRFVAVMGAAFLLLCGLWCLFYRWVIGARLVGPPGLTEHLRHILDRNVPERAYATRRGLVLDLRCGNYVGHDLTALLHRCAAENSSEQNKAPEPVVQREFELACRGAALLLRQCPWLKLGPDDPDPFPGATISCSLRDTDSSSGGDTGEGESDRLLEVWLSDLDTCLSRAELRKSLLRLIRRLKTLCLAGDLAELRISLGFHSYEALLLKAHNIEPAREPMGEVEFAGWAETLLDFTVELPGDLMAELDPGFVFEECRGSRLLRRLPQDLLDQQPVPTVSWRQQHRWLSLRDVDKTEPEWASINCILLKAGALFRQKWETCSSAEKLALYFLARKKRINAANAQLLEQLALQGLIRVDHGSIRILNNSFAYFARHAEDTPTLMHLVEVGEVGSWQQYRLPVTLVILLLLGGIAFTSGSSLYMIAATLLGLLGTLGSLTSSAHMIRQNLN